MKKFWIIGLLAVGLAVTGLTANALVYSGTVNGSACCCPDCPGCDFCCGATCGKVCAECCGACGAMGDAANVSRTHCAPKAADVTG